MSVNLPLPVRKQYRVIYADPPWAYRSCGTARKHYETMSVEDIALLPVGDIATDDAICFLWSTAPQMPEAVRVMQEWGLQYKTVGFVWVKKYPSGGNFLGMGAYTRANAEFCLIGTRPLFRPKRMVLRHDIRQIVEAPLEVHNKKPDVIRDRIVALVGDVSRIELFARQRAAGWDAWGNEVPDSDGDAEQLHDLPRDAPY